MREGGTMFQRKFFCWFVILGLFTSVLAATLTGCGGSSPAASVAVTLAASTVDGNDTTTLTATVTNDKNSAGVTWSVSGGGTLSNTTTTSATFTASAPTSSAQSATITATSIADTAKTGTATISVPAMPAVTSTSANLTGAVGSIYSITLQASGGIAPFTWALGSGTTLPSCLTLKSTGILTTASGTAPTASCAGIYSNITFTVTDSGKPTPLTDTSSALTVTIAAAPAISFTGTMPATGTYNVAYSGSVAATGGAGTLTYSVSSGALPGGLNLNASTGLITGTPSAVGTFNFTIQAADAYGDSNTQSYQIVVSYPAVVITPGAGSLAFAVTGQAYTQQLTASGGSGTGFTWTVAGLPANGLTYSASGATLTINGPASSTGTVNFTAKVTDGAGNSIGPYAYSIQVYSPVTLPATIPVTLPSTATVNVAYTGTVVATGGSGNDSWTVTGLSDGLTSSTSGGTLTISGTPTAAATVTANVSVKDTTTGVTSGPYAYTITVYATVTLPTSNPATLGPAIVSTPYSGTIVAAGGSGNYSWTVTGFPSDGLNYSTSGATLTVSGTPTSVQTVQFTAKVTDTTTNLSSGPYNYSVTVYNPVTLSSTSLPLTATVNVAYSGTITASGGSGSGYVWTVTGLSDGLSSASSGGTLTISGTPTSAATVTFTVSVKDSAGNTAGPTNYTINVYNALSLPSPNPSTLGPATINLAYSGTIVASGGSGNYSWTVTGLPSDSLNNSASGGTLTISGTPTSATTVSFTAKVTDTTTNISVGPYTYTVTVYSGVTLPAPNPASLGPADASSTYSGTIVAAGGSGNYSWTVTGLPADGLNYASSGATLTISGTPTSAQTVQFTAKVTDTTSNLSAGPFTYSIVVNGPLSLPTPDPSSLPANGYTNVSYTGYINASGGSGQYSWTVSGLPSDGLNVSGATNGSTLTISGTPTSPTSGNSPVTVTFNAKVTDTSTGASVTENGYNVIISYPTAVSLPAPNPSSLPSATVNQSYGGSINALGGVAPYTWSINGTTVTGLPGGLSLGNGTLAAYSTGGNSLSISGTPSTTGTVTLTNVKVVDSLSTSATNTYTITVSPVSTLQITINQVPQGMVNMPYTFGNNLSITGGNGPYTCAYSNAPAGLSLQSGTCNLIGIPTSSGSTTVTLKVTDSTTPVAQTQTTTFTLPVVPETVATNNSELKGQYACYWQVFYDNGVTGGTGSTLYRGGRVFAFTADGNGNITGGEGDSNSPTSGGGYSYGGFSSGGTYAVGSDNRGYLLLGSPSGAPAVLAIAGGDLDSNSHFSDFALVEMDDVGPSPNYPTHQHGGGHCYEQNTTALSGIKPSGGYVWGLTGEDASGNIESQVGSAQYSSGSVSGVIDMVDAGTYQGPINISGTNTATDAYGRMTITAGPSGETANTSVWYFTNNAVGEAVGMSANPHNASSDADLLIGEARAQNAAHVATSHPIDGPLVIYLTGLDDNNGELNTYKSMMMQGAGSSSAATFTINVDIENAGGTISTETALGSMSYAVAPTTGRFAFPTSKSGVDVFYFYDTNSAVALFGDGQNATDVQNLIGWMAPQTAPSSGTWATGDLAASYFMSPVSNGGYNDKWNSAALTLNSSGSFTTFAQDSGSQNWADWDEPLSGSTSQSATGALVPDTTLDPNGTYGIFDVNVTQGGTTTTQVYCVAISVDKATNSSTQGRLVCLDATSQSPQFTIVSESD